jgi:HSP20 family protein
VDRNQPVSWLPPVDIEESGDRLFLRAELPGMKPEDIDISFENGVLSLRGERRFENESGQKNYHRVERAYGSFVRSFTLPASVDAEKVVARYHDGILELEMPKRAEARARKIEVKSAGPDRQLEK